MHYFIIDYVYDGLTVTSLALNNVANKISRTILSFTA